MFKQITLAGDPATRGYEHGRQLAERIGETIDIYLKLFARPEQEVAALADHYRTIIADYNPDYIAEMDAIAEGAEVAPWQIVALNARTEIINQNLSECTALWFGEQRILAQNWDWMQALEPLCVIATMLRPDGHWLVTLTEPGILAKIGMNSSGIGVCLNILRDAHGHAGVPVHVLLRAILDTTSYEHARQELVRAGNDKASHILVADHQGNACSVEYSANGLHEVPASQPLLMHTNHYLADGLPDAPSTSTTYARFDRAAQLMSEATQPDVAAVRRILLDTHGAEQSINAAYRPRDDFNGMPAGTVATVIMELSSARMHVSQGDAVDRSFTALDF